MFVYELFLVPIPHCTPKVITIFVLQFYLMYIYSKQYICEVLFAFLLYKFGIILYNLLGSVFFTHYYVKIHSCVHVVHSLEVHSFSPMHISLYEQIKMLVSISSYCAFSPLLYYRASVNITIKS